jgi:hypothetical protein
VGGGGLGTYGGTGHCSLIPEARWGWGPFEIGW